MKLFSTAAIFLAFAATPFLAQSADKAADTAADQAPTAQQQKMSSCNARAEVDDTSMLPDGCRQHDGASTRSPLISTTQARQLPSAR